MYKMPRDTQMTIAERVAARPAPTNLKKGANVKNLDGWRGRLLEAVGKRTYREIAEKAVGSDGKSLAHTTVRSVFIGAGSANIDTLAAICDAVGVDVSRVLGGKSVVSALPPPGGQIKPGSRVAVLPIVPVAQAARWRDLAKRPEDYAELFYMPADDAEGLHVARISDDSMAGTFKAGDVVTYKVGEPEAGEPAIVMLQGAGEAMVRLWRPTGDRVKLTASNEEYGSQTVARSRVEFVAKIVGMARDVA